MKEIKEKYPNTSWDKSSINGNDSNQASTSSSSFSITIHNSYIRDKAGHTPGITLNNKFAPLSDIEDNEDEDKSLCYTEDSEEEGELRVDEEITDVSDNDEPDKSEDKQANYDEDNNSTNSKNWNETKKENPGNKEVANLTKSQQKEYENKEGKSKQQTKTTESTTDNPVNKESKTGAISKNNKVNKKDNNNKPNTRSNKL